MNKKPQQSVPMIPAGMGMNGMPMMMGGMGQPGGNMPFQMMAGGPQGSSPGFFPLMQNNQINQGNQPK